MQAQTAPHGVQCPPVPSPQVSGSRLRLLQVTAADSGEYVCRVSSGATTKEASVMVTIQPSGASSYREWGPGRNRGVTCGWLTLPGAAAHVLGSLGSFWVHCYQVPPGNSFWGQPCMHTCRGAELPCSHTESTQQGGMELNTCCVPSSWGHGTA